MPKTATQQEKLDYLNEYVRSRGYAHRTHRLLANYDLDAFKAMNPVPVRTAVDQRILEQQTKELLLIVNFACLRAPRYIIATHIRKALAFGATQRRILEAIEMLMPEAGRTIFEEALLAWDEVVSRAPTKRQEG